MSVVGTMRDLQQRVPFCPMVTWEAESPEAGLTLVLLADLGLRQLSKLIVPVSSLSLRLPS